MDGSSRIRAQTNNLLVRREIEGTYLESFLASRLTTMNDLDLQSFQVARKHPSFGIVQGGQVLRTRFPEDTSGKGDKVATLIHGTDCGIAIEIEFSLGSGDIEVRGNRFQGGWTGKCLSCRVRSENGGRYQTSQPFPTVCDKLLVKKEFL